MKKLIAALIVAFPMAAFAAEPPAQNPPPPQQQGGGPNPEMHERMQRRMRTALLLEITEALNLSDQEALKVRDVIDRVAAKRQPLQQKVMQAAKTVRAAAEGEAAALQQVDSAINLIFDTRAQIQQLDREAYNEVARGLSPQQRAKLAIVFARFHQGGRGMGGRGMGGRGMGGDMGPGMGPGMGGRRMGPGRFEKREQNPGWAP